MAKFLENPDGTNIGWHHFGNLIAAYYCKHGAGFIFPETEDGKKAIQKADGSWLCYHCQVEDMIKMMNTNH